MRLDIGKYVVTIKDSLTWGDVQQVQSATISGAKVGPEGLRDFDIGAMLEAKYRLLEVSVVRVFEGEAEIPFTRDWMNGLSEEDGNTLYSAVEALIKKK